MVLNLGKAFGTFIKRSGGQEIALSGDVRLSTPSLIEQFKVGVLSTGIDVINIGILPTPVNYFSMFHLGVFGAVQITGSHNPPEFNGFKLSLNRKPVVSSREMALKHSRKNGATLFGVDSKLKFDCEWAAWSNGTAVRELDFHDTFLAADYSHPGDNIPPLISVAQQNKKSGLDLLRGIITAYEVQVNLVKGICLHKHKVDHIAHLGPSVAAGLGTCLLYTSPSPRDS